MILFATKLEKSIQTLVNLLVLESSWELVQEDYSDNKEFGYLKFIGLLSSSARYWI